MRALDISPSKRMDISPSKRIGQLIAYVEFFGLALVLFFMLPFAFVFYAVRQTLSRVKYEPD